MFFDTHVHLDDNKYNNDRDNVINRALKEDVNLFLNAGIDTKSNIESIKLAEKYSFIYAACGFHPHDASKFTEEDYEIIKKLISNEKVIGIGEIGLDYYRNLSPKNIQQNVFKRFINLAKESKKPIILHSRDAFDDTIRILEETNAKEIGGIAHCFSGTIDMANKFLDMNFYISFAGQITFKNARNMKELIEQIPMDRILIETDCPYISPEPRRGSRNEPSFVKYTAQKIAEIKLLSAEDVGRITRVNAIKLFNLPISLNPAIVYPIRDSIYLNITNRCSNDCYFCIRTKQDYVKGHNLRISSEPTSAEIIKNVEPLIKKYREVVFCGYGEPLLRLDTVLEVANALRDKSVKYIRINTNGQGNLFYNENIVPKFKEIIDEICISLNASDKEAYMKICHPEFGERTFDEVLNFIKECKKVIPKVVITFVELPEINLDACRAIAQKLDVAYKIRKLDVVG